MALLDLGFNDYAQAATDFAGAAGDLLSAAGYRKERDAYATAATYADKNAEVEKQSTQIQLAANAITASQSARETYKTIGGQRADVAGAGLAESGSALDVLHDSETQASLQKQQINEQGGLISKQGEINVNAYQAQSAAYVGQAQQADATADASDAAAAGATAAGVVHAGAGLIHTLTLGLF